MSDKSGGYTLNQDGLRKVERGAARWAKDAREAFEAGGDIPRQSGYMPEFLDSDEDFETFASECQSLFDPAKAAANRDSQSLDWSNAKAVSDHAKKHEDNLPLWLHWLVIGPEEIRPAHEFADADFIVTCANEYAASRSPTTGEMGTLGAYNKGTGWTMKSLDGTETWSYRRGATPKEVAFVASIAILLYS